MHDMGLVFFVYSFVDPSGSFYDSDWTEIPPVSIDDRLEREVIIR